MKNEHFVTLFKNLNLIIKKTDNLFSIKKVIFAFLEVILPLGNFETLIFEISDPENIPWENFLLIIQIKQSHTTFWGN